MIIRGRVLAVVVGTALLVVSGCSSSGSSASRPATTVSFQVRPVLAERAAKPGECNLGAAATPSPSAAARLSGACSTDASTYYVLGPAVITQDRVTEVSLQASQGGSGEPPIVAVTLDGQGTVAFGKVTALANAKQSPQNQFAILVDGKVVSSPQVSSGPITGGQLQVSFPTEDAAVAFVRGWSSAVASSTKVAKGDGGDGSSADQVACDAVAAKLGPDYYTASSTSTRAALLDGEAAKTLAKSWPEAAPTDLFTACDIESQSSPQADPTAECASVTVNWLVDAKGRSERVPLPARASEDCS